MNKISLFNKTLQNKNYYYLMINNNFLLCKDLYFNKKLLGAITLKELFDYKIQEEPASRALCTSGKPDSALGASQLASCKSQGYRSRDGGKSHKVGSERIKVRGKRIKGKKYGGPLPDWS